MSTVATIGAHALQVHAEVWKTDKQCANRHQSQHLRQRQTVRPPRLARSRAFLNIQTKEQDQNSSRHRAIPFIAIALWGGSWVLTSRGVEKKRRA